MSTISMDTPGVPAPPDLVAIPIPGPLPQIAYVDPDTTYQSALLDAITAALTAQLQSLGMGVSQTVQTQDTGLFQTRQNYEFLKAGNNAGIVYDAMGWKLPSATRAALQQETLNNLAYVAQESIDRIAIQSFNLAQKNIWEAREMSLDSESARMEFIYEAVKIAVEIFTAQVLMVETIVAKDLGIAEVVNTWNEDQISLYKTDAAIYAGTVKAQAREKAADIEEAEAQVAAQVGINIITEKTTVADKGIAQEALNATTTINAQIQAAGYLADTTHYQESYTKSESVTQEQSATAETIGTGSNKIERITIIHEGKS